EQEADAAVVERAAVQRLRLERREVVAGARPLLQEALAGGGKGLVQALQQGVDRRLAADAESNAAGELTRFVEGEFGGEGHITIGRRSKGKGRLTVLVQIGPAVAGAHESGRG